MKKAAPFVMAVIIVFSAIAACDLFIPKDSRAVSAEDTSGAGGGGSGSSGGGSSGGGSSGGSGYAGPASLGFFGGKVRLGTYLVDAGALLEVFDNNTFLLKLEEYPNYSLQGNYTYSPGEKIVKLTGLTLNTAGKSVSLGHITTSVPGEVRLKAIEWDLARSIALNLDVYEVRLDRTNGSGFASSRSYAALTVDIQYPDASMNGKSIITEVQFLNGEIPSILSVNTISGSSVTEKFQIDNSLLGYGGKDIYITSYIYTRPEDLNIELGYYGGTLGPMITRSYFLESSDNPWQPGTVHTINRNSDRRVGLSFPKRLNLKLDSMNYTTNNPVLSWDPYPGASNGYLIIFLLWKKEGYFNISENHRKWTFIGSTFSRENSVVLSTDLRFTEGYSSLGVHKPNVLPGDLVRYEVYVLDGSEILGVYGKGALYMDSLTIIR